MEKDKLHKKPTRPSNCFFIWAKKERPFLFHQMNIKNIEQQKNFLSYYIPDSEILFNTIGIINDRLNNSQISKILGIRWKYFVPDDTKIIYYKLQNEEKEKHKKQFCQYKYLANSKSNNVSSIKDKPKPKLKPKINKKLSKSKSKPRSKNKPKNEHKLIKKPMTLSKKLINKPKSKYKPITISDKIDNLKFKNLELKNKLLFNIEKDSNLSNNTTLTDTYKDTTTDRDLNTDLNSLLSLDLQDNVQNIDNFDNYLDFNENVIDNNFLDCLNNSNIYI